MILYMNLIPKGESTVQVEASINGKDVKQNDDDPDENEEVEDEDASSDEELETDSEDNLSDLKADSSDNESEKEGNENVNSESNQVDEVSETKTVDAPTETNTDNDNAKANIEEKVDVDVLKRKKIVDKERAELPYTFDLPDSYEHLHKLFENQSSVHQSVIIERMIKCNHPSLSEGNKDNLGLLFAYMLQYLNDLFAEATDANTIKNSFEIFKALVPQIYNLASFNPENTHNSVLEVLKEKHGEFRMRRKEYPGLEVLIFMRLISFLFPTSDFRHQVVTPSFVFIEQILNKCRVRIHCIIEEVFASCHQLLSGILHMAIPKTGVKLIKVLPPFKPISSLLVLLENYSLESFDSYQMDGTDLSNTEIKEEYKVKILYNVIKLFYVSFMTTYKNYPVVWKYSSLY
ncbi:hypothetical protein NQ318_011521 [Aromia moschata]|uniref:Uncharacterized protein n=1 Tax=Aromia moschata TaxID=1265417 RepID=A0AAV8XR95_9CUCU|nr:hypothetical protein NQ318_011521 [Aromia moschata]